MKKNMSASLSDFVDNIYTLKALTRYNNKFKIISEFNQINWKKHLANMLEEIFNK